MKVPHNILFKLAGRILAWPIFRGSLGGAQVKPRWMSDDDPRELDFAFEHAARMAQLRNPTPLISEPSSPNAAPQRGRHTALFNLNRV